jgi:nucleoid-associated protein YgaU
MSASAPSSPNARTIRQELDTAIEGTRAQGIIEGLSGDMLQRLTGALGTLSSQEREEAAQRIMRMTPESAENVLAGIIASGKKTYTVRPGDSLSKIARAHNVDLEALVQANPQIKNRDLIHPDQTITLPR